MCSKHPPKVFVARVLVEARSAAGQDIVLFWLHIFKKRLGCFYGAVRVRYYLDLVIVD